MTQSAADLDALPTLSGDHGIPADAWRCLSKRDEAMAANALAALAHAEGASILLFAHTSHILNAPMVVGRFSGQQQPPQSMGETLRHALGRRYVAIAEIEPVSPIPASAPPRLASTASSGVLSAVHDEGRVPNQPNQWSDVFCTLMRRTRCASADAARSVGAMTGNGKCYCNLSAVEGSTRDARRAGK